MSNNTQQIPPGLIQPTMASFPPGAGNARDAAILSQQQMNNRQANLTSGGKRRKYRGGQQVAVPQFQMQYAPRGGPGTNPNDQIQNMSSTSMQSTSWSANDSYATKMGGKRKSRKGGNSDWKWGCYSGGRRRTKKFHSKKHHKKSRRSRRK